MVALWNKKSKLSRETLDSRVRRVTIGAPQTDHAPLSKIEMMLRQKEIENQDQDFLSVENEHIVSELKKFGMVKRSPLHEKAIDFWAKNKSTFKEIYELAEIVNAVPVTQVTVERAFSSLAFILTALRNSLHADTLENILLIRLNRDIFENIPLF